jgi:hypothetical protein
MRQWLAGVVVGAISGAGTTIGLLSLLGLLGGQMVPGAAAQAESQFVPYLQVQRLELVEPSTDGTLVSHGVLKSEQGRAQLQLYYGDPSDQPLADAILLSATHGQASLNFLADGLQRVSLGAGYLSTGLIVYDPDGSESWTAP